jgi:hypothetical protein
MDCTPIRSENHFIGEKKCSDCVPYLVLKVDTTPGLRTTSQVQKIHTVDIKAYFRDDSPKVYEMKELVEGVVYSPGCIELGDCGCFCLQGAGVSSIRPVAGGLNVYSLTFRGTYRRSDSVSESESV